MDKKSPILLLCPDCKRQIPEITFVSTTTLPIAKINCPCLTSQKRYQIGGLMHEIQYSVHSKGTFSCSSTEHDRWGEKFCIDCCKWLCLPCIKQHQKEFDDHHLLGYYIEINCQKHDKNFSCYCFQCRRNICEECKKEHNKEHCLEGIPPIDIPAFEEKLRTIEVIIERNSKTKELFKNLVCQPALNLSPETIADWEKKFDVILNGSHQLNSLFRKYMYSLYFTVITLKNHPNYLLGKLVKNIRINNKMFNSNPIFNIEKLFSLYKNFFRRNFIFFLEREVLRNILLRFFDPRPMNQCFQTLEDHTVTVKSLLQLNDKTLVSGSEDGEIKLWNIESGDCIGSLHEHTRGIACLIQLNNGSMASASIDKTIKLWSTTELECCGTLEGHKKSVLCLASINDELLVSGSQDKTMKLWDIQKLECIKTISNAHDDFVYCLAFDQDINVDLLASGALDCSIKLWGTKDFVSTITLEGHQGDIYCLRWLRNGLLASGSGDTTIKLWNVETKQCVMTNKMHDSLVTSLFQLSDGRMASGSLDSSVKLWKIDTFNFDVSLEEHVDAVYAIFQLHDGTLASGAMDATIKLWKI